MKLSNSNQLCVNYLLEITHKVERTRRTVGEVDLDNHGDVLLGECVDHLAQEHQHASRKGHLVKKGHLYCILLFYQLVACYMIFVTHTFVWIFDLDRKITLIVVHRCASLPGLTELNGINHFH